VHGLHLAMVVCLPCCAVMLAGMEDFEVAASGRLQRAGAAAPEGRAATSLWCGDVACHGLGGDLGRVGGRAVGSVGHILEVTVGNFFRAAAPDELVCCPWSAVDCPMQLGLRVVSSCGYAARERAVVCRGGSPRRWWSWLTRRARQSSGMSGQRLQVFVNFEGV
jgi:hypothetical protein